MGYETWFTGRITVTPHLNAAEIAYLNRFADSRRILRKNGPYYVDAGGSFGQDDEPDIIEYSTPPPHQPNAWCKWIPTPAGDGIMYDDTKEKFYDSEVWMLYLVDTFLRPGATLQAELRDPVEGHVYAEELAAFTFDHDVDGVLLAQGDYQEDVWRLIVRHNTVLYQDGTLDKRGNVTFDAPEIPVTYTEGRPTR